MEKMPNVCVVIFLLFTINCSGHPVEVNYMGGACVTYGGGWCLRGFWRKNLKETDHLGDLGVDGETILKYIYFLNWRVWNGLIWLSVK